MKIVVDAAVLAREKKTGIDYYTRNLLRATVLQRQKDSFELAYLSSKPADLGVSAGNVRTKRYLLFPERLYSGILHYLNVIPFNLLSRTSGDVYIFPNYSRPPLLGSAKSIVFVYDLAFARQDAINTHRHKKFLDSQIKDAVKKSSHIVVCSESTKRDIIDLYSPPASMITVIPPAIDAGMYRPRKDDEVGAVRTKYGLPEDYILYLGTLEPRKNVARLMQSYASLPEDIKERHALVLVGGKGWLDAEIESSYAKLSKSNNIIRTGYVPEEDKPAIYSGASLFVYPALYEGFGMPVLEAMACGVPVVTSNTSSLPEAVGQAGIMVDPLKNADIASAMERVLRDKGLSKKLSNAGIKRSAEFSWDDGAKELSHVISQVCKK